MRSGAYRVVNDSDDERRTMMIGAGIALLILAGIVIVVLRFVTPDERLLVLQRDSVQSSVSQKVQEGDRIRITGTIRRFGFARGFDATTPGDTGGNNALDVISIEPAEGRDAGDDTVDVVDARNDEMRQGDRVEVVGEVDDILSDNFFSLTE